MLKLAFLLKSRSLRFMISVAMKIAIKSKIGVYELRNEIPWDVEHTTL
jgi:hypothetical protein